MLILDTHALIWWTTMPKRLSRRAARAIRSTDRLGVPSICFWETALLVRRQKLALDLRIVDWAKAVLSIPRVQELALNAMTAVQADGLEMHPDPADRFIVATALQHDATLVTKDELLQSLSFVATLW